MASDSDSDEDFVTYGTPLEPLEEDEPLKKPIPLHEQTVKDEKGRYQRFHGAFTGGFSAGYFNTVGTKEGWTPSTFVSSRQQKAEKHQARPEDFMDEEDFSEHGIAPRGITTSHEFSSARRDELRDKARAVNAQAALIPGDTLLEELITPARSTIGVELLRRMGWKEGQGVGPRVKRRARRQQPEGGNKMYGCALPPAGSEDSEQEEDNDEEFAPENVTFAPKDVTPLDFNPKVGLQGLGYRGLDPGLALHGRGGPQHINLFNPRSDARSGLFGGTVRDGRRRGVAGQAFGVGALEDEDEDIYHRDSMSTYDTVLGGEEPGDGLFGWTAPEQYSKKTDKSRDGSYLGKILEGFTLAQKPAEEKTIFPPPTLPADFRPVRRLRPSVDVLRLSGVSPALAEALKTSRGHMVREEPQQGGRHQLDSGQRRTLLGEDALQGPSSVMDLLRPEDRERLLNLRNSSAKSDTSAKSATPACHKASLPAGLPAQGGATSSGLQQEALAVWRGAKSTSTTFRPFEKDPSKQARYELYLSRLKQGDRDALEQSLDPGQTEWERSREREEFVRASILYRPSSSSLSSRFTRGQHRDDEDNVQINKDQEGDNEAASEAKTFGKLTRETLEWHPDKLLCKRFNVPDPYPGSSLVGVPKVKRDKFSVFNFLTVMDSRDTPPPVKAPQPARRSRWDVADQSEEQQERKDPLSELLSAARQQADNKLETSSAPALPAPSGTGRTEKQLQQSSGKKNDGDGEEEKVEEEEEEEEEEESRPPMDLFKAIFAGSSDEASSSSSSSDGEANEEEDTKEEEETPNLFNITPTVSSSVTSTTTPTQQQTDAVVPSQNSRREQEEGEEFGPKLPPPSAAPPSRQTDTGGATSMSSLAEEEHKHKRSKEKKHKNKKQHKHKKEKKKKKQKKHKHKGKEQKKRSRKEASDSSSEDSDEDGDSGARQVSAQELLQRLKNMPTHQRW